MEWTQQGFIIILTEEDAIKLFVTAICISLLASVDHYNRKPWSIYNSRKDPNNVTPSMNALMYKALAPNAMHFVYFLVQLLQKYGKPTL